MYIFNNNNKKKKKKKKIDIFVAEGTHQSDAAVNKQLNEYV